MFGCDSVTNKKQMNTQINPLENPLTAEEVEAWGDFMEYIENLVLNKLGLTKKQ